MAQLQWLLFGPNWHTENKVPFFFKPFCLDIEQDIDAEIKLSQNLNDHNAHGGSHRGDEYFLIGLWVELDMLLSFHDVARIVDSLDELQGQLNIYLCLFVIDLVCLENFVTIGFQMHFFFQEDPILILWFGQQQLFIGTNAALESLGKDIRKAAVLGPKFMAVFLHNHFVIEVEDIIRSGHSSR